MAKPLNSQTVKAAISNMQLQVQSGKVRDSKKTIRKLQLSDRFSDDFTSFFTSIRSANEYRTPQKFFDKMEKSPKLWDKKFFYIGERNTRLAEAALYAIGLIERKANQYGVITGLYRSSFKMMLDDRMFTNEARLLDPGIDSNSIFTIYNATEYASTSEVNALYYSRIGGIMFYAANHTFKRFPELGVVFNYTDAALGLTHKYAVPFLSIGPKREMIGGITRPGANRKGRRKVRSRKRRIAKKINQRFS